MREVHIMGRYSNTNKLRISQLRLAEVLTYEQTTESHKKTIYIKLTGRFFTHYLMGEKSLGKSGGFNSTLLNCRMCSVITGRCHIFLCISN